MNAQPNSPEHPEETARRRGAERRDIIAEKELRDLIENMPAMAGVLLPDGSHPYLTKQWREDSGLSGARTDFEGLRRAVDPEDHGLHLGKIRAAAAGRQPIQKKVRMASRADGQ